MNYIIQFLLDHIRNISLLFAVFGLINYFVDYKATKEKPEHKREKTFSRVVSHLYMIGGVSVYLVAVLVSMFL